MVRCSFCRAELQRGSGKMYIKKDGTILYFSSSKCEKNYFLGRKGRETVWTEEYQLQKKKVKEASTKKGANK